MRLDLKTYADYKDSGLPCLGQVPEHWEVRRIRNAVDMRESNVDKHTTEGETSVRLCNYVDVYRNERITDGMGFMKATASTDEIERFRLNHGDVLITKDSESWNDIGVPALVEYAAPDLVCGYHLAMLRPRQSVLDGGYLLRAMQSPGIAYQLHIEANGVTRYGLSHAAIKSVWLPLAPLPEQAAIVRYLDYMDRRIRRYIRAKRKLIKLLDEQKQVIIHHAVTGQIDVRTGKPYPAYKDSGVEWLGQVPEHWNVQRLKTICRLVYGDALPGDVREEGTTPVLGSNGRVGYHSSANTSAPCIVIGRKGSFGKVNFSSEPVFAIDTTFFVDDRFSAADIRWLFYVLGWLRLDQVSGDSAVPGLAREDAYQRLVVVPTPQEQAAIARYLDDATANAGSAIAHAQREISLLREYRTRLIADVVTGKLDVREAAANLPAEEGEPDVDAEGVFLEEEQPERGDAGPVAVAEEALA